MSDIDNAISAMRPVKAGSVRSRVRDSIREAIFSGKLKPGDAIREAHMAKALQVSQPTVREALIELEHAGLVVRNPQRDTVVTRLAPEDIRERSRIRVLLEPEATIEAMGRMKPEEFAELERLLGEIHHALERDSYEEYAQSDIAFHRAIWRFSGNRMLYKLLDLTTVPLFAFLSIQRSRTLRALANVVHSHDPILTAMRAGDAERVREAFRHHIEGSYAKFTGRSDQE